MKPMKNKSALNRILTVLAGVFLLGVPAVQAEDAPAPADVQQLMDAQAAADKRLREEVQTQTLAHIEAGKRLYEAFEYQQAILEFEKAVALDRSNAEARKWLTKTQDVVGLRMARIKSAVEQLYGEQKIAVQERLAELDNRIDWGNKFVSIAKGDPELTLSERIRKYEQALQSFERAREIVKWMPPNINVEEQHNQIVRMIRESRRAIKELEVELAEADRERAVELAKERTIREREYQQKKINVLLDQAIALFEIGEYEKAERLAGKVLELDPTNAEANTIEASSRARRHVTRQQWIDEEKIWQDKVQILRADRMGVPHGGYLVYPDNWHEIDQRTGDSARRKTEETWKAEFRKKLGRRVSFEFVDTPLEEALAFLDSLTKVNFILDPKVDAEGAGKVAISLRVQDMELEMALKWILRLAELDYELRNQAVFITKKANLASAVELEIYDIRDLTTTITDFPGPRLELGTANNTGAGGGAGNPFLAQPTSVQLAPQDLADMIQQRLLPQEFQDPATSIQESGGKLVVMQRPEVHDKIRQLLQSFRETQTIQVLTNVRYIDVLDGFLEQIGVHFQGLDAAPGTDYDPDTAGFQALPNVAGINPLAVPSRSGLFPIGGGPGIGAAFPVDDSGAVGTTPSGLPSATDSSVPYQFLRYHNPNNPNFLPNPQTWGYYNLSSVPFAPATLPDPRNWGQNFFPLQYPAGGSLINPTMVLNNNLPNFGIGQNSPGFIRPRLDPNFPASFGAGTGGTTFNPANAPAGFRRQLFGPQTLFQAFTQNLVNNLGGAGPLANALTGQSLGQQGAVFQFRFFNSSQAAAVVHAVKKDQNADQLIAPRLTQFNNQRAHVLVATQQSYIADYDVSGAVYDPVIRSFLVGVVLDLRPVVSYDRKYITMDIRTGTATEFVVPTREVAIQNPLIPIFLFIQLPDLELRSVSTTVTVPDNGTLLFSGLIHDRKFASKSGIPFFSDLPVIGRIFSTNVKHRERRNLLILINSRVILFDEEEEKL